MRWTKGNKEKTLHRANRYAIPDVPLTGVQDSRGWAHACGRHGEQGLGDPTGAKTLVTTTKVRMANAIKLTGPSKMFHTKAPARWVGRGNGLSLLGHVESTWEVLRSHDTESTIHANFIYKDLVWVLYQSIRNMCPRLSAASNGPHVARDRSRV